MLNKQRLLNLMTLGLLLIGTAPTFAQSTANPSARSDRKLTRVLFKPPPDDKKPDQTAEAGSRHGVQCLQDTTSPTMADTSSSHSILMPLVPMTNFGLTITERPKLWIYLPETSARQVVLSIREEGTIHHSKTFIPITGESGIISLQPKPDSSSLEMGKTYKLSVVLVCGAKPSPNDPALDTWVRRIDQRSEPINQVSALEQASWYGEQGIWYDALNSLIQARQSQPQNQDLIDIWATFLESVGLKAIANEPVQF